MLRHAVHSSCHHSRQSIIRYNRTIFAANAARFLTISSSPDADQSVAIAKRRVRTVAEREAEAADKAVRASQRRALAAERAEKIARMESDTAILQTIDPPTHDPNANTAGDYLADIVEDEHNDGRIIDDVTFGDPTTSETRRTRSSKAAKTTFVSAHYQVDPADVHSYLRRHELPYRETGDKLVVKECPFCPPIHNKLDNMYKLAVWTTTGSHHCIRCGAKGSWFDLKRKLGDLQDATLMSGKSVAQKTAAKTTVAMQSKLNAYAKSLQKFPAVLQYLTVKRGLRQDVLDLYQVGAGEFSFEDENGQWAKEECVTFPWTRIVQKQQRAKKGEKAAAAAAVEETKKAVAPTAADGNTTTSPPLAAEGASEAALDSDSTPSPIDASALSSSPPATRLHIDRIKYRSISEKAHTRMYPSGAGWGLFGLHTVPAETEEIILTEGEFDAMAAYQCTGIPAVSLPNGCNSLPIDVLPLLEPYKRIYLWMDDDTPGQDGVAKFSKKLGLARCMIVRTRNGQLVGPKDANDAMLQGHDLKGIVERAEAIPHEQITTFQEMRAEVYRELCDPDSKKGTQLTTIPALSAILKGHRRGELTIFTGATGVGKTTVLSQLSLDYCAQGVNTLWGSFEIKNSRLARTMITQLSAIDFGLGNNIDLFNLWADRFETLPMYFMRFFGSSSIDQVLDAMEYAVYAYDVQHIILDNLQFMLSGQGARFHDSKYDIQDRAVDAFRTFATTKDVHISLVIHPRKEADLSPLGVASVFGSAKSTQEADNVIIIQSPSVQQTFNNGRMQFGSAPVTSEFDEYRKIEVKKNRFDGQLGSVPFVYDRNTKRIIQVSAGGKKFEGEFSKHQYLHLERPEAVIGTPFPAGIVGGGSAVGGSSTSSGSDMSSPTSFTSTTSTEAAAASTPSHVNLIVETTSLPTSIASEIVSPKRRRTSKKMATSATTEIVPHASSTSAASSAPRLQPLSDDKSLANNFVVDTEQGDVDWTDPHDPTHATTRSNIVRPVTP